MGEPDASSAEMPGFPFPRWPGGELNEPLLDALLTGQPLPPAAPEQLRAVARMLASLALPAGPGELAGETAARFAFTCAASPAGISPAARRPGRRRPSWLPAQVSARLAAGLVAAAVGLGGAAAAYADVLPGPIQDLAHHMIHAPAPHPASRPRPRPAEHKPPARSQPAQPATANSHAQPHHHGKASGHARPRRHARPHRHPSANPHPSARPHPSASPSAASQSQRRQPG